MGWRLGSPVAAQGPLAGMPRRAPRVHNLHPLHAALLREVLRNPDREGVRAPNRAPVQDCGVVYAGAYMYHHIRDQHDRDLGESDGETAQPDISKNSDPKDGIF